MTIRYRDGGGVLQAPPLSLPRHIVPLFVLLATLALLLSTQRLATPPRYVFDELYYVYTAQHYVDGQEAYDAAILPRDDPALEWTHPPLAKLIIAGGILAAGDNPVGWRLASVLFGVAGVCLTCLLGFSLSGQLAVGAGAGSLLLLDNLYLVESRTGMSNLIYTVFTLAALAACYRALTLPVAQARLPLLLTGVFLGLALATKWSAAALWGWVGIALLWRGWQLYRAPGATLRHLGRDWALPVALAMLVTPALIYAASWLHFFLTGHSLADLFTLHQEMFRYHRNLGVVHADSSAWWEWPLTLQPVHYFQARRPGEVMMVLGNGNPALYLPMALAVAWVAVDWWGRRSAALWILLIGFFGQWLPWALSPRGTFVYHFLPAVPFGCIALGVLVAAGWRRGGAWRWGAVAYVVTVGALFLWFYPLNTAVTLTTEQVAQRLWLPSWR
ncbi:MAG: phospholipid carrier-dependent glycosyltransferase [Chloroflexota bacterium]|nr:phospholipid carrier-dependent glycosyltransferase [Chloroflexota bacterium]